MQLRLALTRYCFTSTRLSTNHRPACIAHTAAILLHGYWAMYDPPPDPPCVCHTPYNIGNGNIV